MNIRKNIMTRFGMLYIVMLIPAFFILKELFLLKTFKADDYKSPVKSEVSNHIVHANRGDILDIKGRKIACYVPNYRIYMDMNANGLSDDIFNKNVDSLALCLSRFFKDRNKDAYKRELQSERSKKTRYYQVHPKRLSYTELQTVKTFPLFRMGRNNGGFIVEQNDNRELPFGSLGARTIGKLYGEGAKGGMVGIENAYEDRLKGVEGLAVLRRISGRWIQEVVVPPIEGLDVVAHLDISIQDVAEHALRKQLVRHDARYGVAILMEVQTGAIKAIVNLHRKSRGHYIEDHLNYAIAESAEPGSTFKLASMLVLLDDAGINPQDTIDTGNGTITFYGQTMSDVRGYGKMSIQESFEKSSNVAISKLVFNNYKDDQRRFVDRLYKMGINKPLGIELKGEGDPVIKNPDDATWSGITLPWMSIGYEVQMAPIQILTLYNAVANKGKMMRPMFVKEITRNGKVVERFDPVVLNSAICSKATVEKIHELLVGVVENGTAKNIKNDFYSIAGKTGTAQIAKGSQGYKTGGTEHQASFVGYFPADKPKYSCIVVVNAPSNNVIYGNVVAGTVFREIADRVYASDHRLNRQPLTADADIKGNYPVSKGGRIEGLAMVCKELKINTIAEQNITDWVTTQATDTAIIIKSKPIPEGIVPSVIGMGAKDAVSVLENLGLYVRIQGIGKVVSQSIKAGTSYRKGDTVFIGLG